MYYALVTLAATALLVGCTTGPERSAESAPPSGTYGTAPPAGGTATAPSAAGRATQVSEAELEQYVDVRRQLASQDPEMARAFESGDLKGQRETLEAAMSGSPMSVDRFMRVHQQVQASPELRARVDARVRAPGASGAGPAGSGTTGEGGTLPGWRGGPSSATPPTTSGGAGTSGAVPSASPQ